MQESRESAEFQVAQLSQKLERMEKRLEELQKQTVSLLEEAMAVVRDYKLRFGYALGKNCPHCGARIGSASEKYGRAVTKCPRCERPLGEHKAV